MRATIAGMARSYVKEKLAMDAFRRDRQGDEYVHATRHGTLLRQPVRRQRG